MRSSARLSYNGRSAERSVHLSFVVSPWVKAAIAPFEIVGGVAALFVTKQVLVDLAVWVTSHEVAEDTSDDLDTQVLSNLNTRTLVNGAAVPVALISDGLHIEPSQLRSSLERLAQRGSVRLKPQELVILTPEGHAFLATI